MSENEVLELWAKNDKAEHQNSTHINKMRIDFERKFAIAQAEIENLSKNSISDEKINDLEDELNIEKEKARTAMELARIEINGAEQRFKEILDEKENIIKKSRSLAQNNEDNQVKSQRLKT